MISILLSPIYCYCLDAAASALYMFLKWTVQAYFLSSIWMFVIWPYCLKYIHSSASTSLLGWMFLAKIVKRLATSLYLRCSFLTY